MMQLAYELDLLSPSLSSARSGGEGARRAGEEVSEPGRLALRQVDPTTEPGWDSLVLSHPDHSFFHSAAWARVLKETYGFTPQYFIFSDDTGVTSQSERRAPARRETVFCPAAEQGIGAPGHVEEARQQGGATLPRSPDQPEVTARQEPPPSSVLRPPSSMPHGPNPPRFLGILPLMEARSWIRGTRGVSLPFTDECAPLWSSSVDANVLLETVLRHGEARRWRFWEIRGGRDLFGRGSTGHWPVPSGDSPDGPPVVLLGIQQAATSLGSALEAVGGSPTGTGESPVPPIPQSASHLGHVLDLSDAPDVLFARFDPSVRRAIRKSEKAGLHVEISCHPEALRQFYRLHCLTRGRHGVPPQPFSFFEAIQKHVIDPGHGFIVLATLGENSPEPRDPAQDPERRAPARQADTKQVGAEQGLGAPTTDPLPLPARHEWGEGRGEGNSKNLPLKPNLNPELDHKSSIINHKSARSSVLGPPSSSGPSSAPTIAASVFFHLGRRAIYKFGASDFRHQDLRANNLVMWTAIQHLAREGFSTLDFGRTDPSNSGLRAFKLGWGTTETVLPYYRYDFRSRTFVKKAGQSRWVGRLGWLPGPFARLVGALLYPHLE